MTLLAMTHFHSSMLLAALVTFLAMAAAGIAFGRGQHKSTLGSAALALHGLLLFLAAAAWLWPILYLGAWGFWIGDNEHWFYGATPYVAGAIALAYASWFIWRVRRGRSTKAYLRVHRWGSVALLAMFVAGRLSEFVEPILGQDPRAAAQRYVSDWPENERLRLVERPVDPGFRTDREFRSYLVLGEREPRGKVTVVRYARYWWTLASSHRFPPSQSELKRAMELLQTSRDPELALERLKSIVQTYPDTDAATEAAKLLSQHEP